MSNNNSRAGFSLVEMIVSIGVVSLIGVAIVTFQRNMISSSRVLSENLRAQQQIRQLFKEFESESRTMSPSQAGAYPIAEASSTSLTFYSDYDKDGYKERIRYFYSTTTNKIRKGIIEPSGVGTTTYNSASEVVVDKVANVTFLSTTTPLFEYYDTSYDGVGTTSPLSSPVTITNVRHIKMFIVLRSAGSVNASSTLLFLETRVTPRNIKDNL